LFVITVPHQVRVGNNVEFTIQAYHSTDAVGRPLTDAAIATPDTSLNQQMRWGINTTTRLASRCRFKNGMCHGLVKFTKPNDAYIVARVAGDVWVISHEILAVNETVGNTN